MTYVSTKTYGHEVGLSCCFRQWRALSHCRLFHGYALAVRIEFAAEELDSNNWVIDFGSLKPVKVMLERYFDHRLVVAEDDPQLPRLLSLAEQGIDPAAAPLAQVTVLPDVGCEAFARFIFDQVHTWLVASGHSERVHVASVEVSEHGANSAIYKV